MLIGSSGWTAIRDCSDGDEIVLSLDIVKNTGFGHVVLSFDGGDSINSAFGIGAAAFYIKMGAVTVLEQRPIIVPSLASAQQAEAAVGNFMLDYSTLILAKVHREFSHSVSNILVTGDSINTIRYMQGHGKLRSANLSHYLLSFR